jgi:hypothetical protein
MSIEEKDNIAQNAPKTFSEIMEQLKAALNKATQSGTPIDPVTLQEITDLIHYEKAFFAPFANTFTPKNRTQLVGGGIKNLGFIETTYGSASANLQFIPPYLNMTEYSDAIQYFTCKLDEGSRPTHLISRSERALSRSE